MQDPSFKGRAMNMQDRLVFLHVQPYELLSLHMSHCYGFY